MLHVLWHIVTGFVVGLIARAVLPGGDQMGLIATTLLSARSGSGIGTYSVAGAQFEDHTVWVSLVTYPLCAAV
jgi:uncharacterized membrane protein YeaQ/YmgE (transglycosylase-associated protein family)